MRGPECSTQRPGWVPGRFTTWVTALMSVAIIGGGRLSAGVAPRDSPVTVLHFERMTYPLYAKVRLIEGVVVLSAAIDAQGRVAAVSTVSGAKALLDESRENLKKWRFASSMPGSLVVVYWFRIRGQCEPPCPSEQEYYPPNLVVVTSGRMIATQ